jgi:serine/threonine protein phosphatase PrpC
MKFSVYQLSRKGGREKNEDRMGYCYTREAGMFAVADGMGGHPEGEVASQLALETLAARFQREARPRLGNPARFLQQAVMAGHQSLLRYATDRALADTPRTTVVACVLQGPVAYWAHCGDSRLYLLRGDKLLARTRDHSYSEMHAALSKGVPAPERFNRNVLFTCLGSPTTPVVDSSGPLRLKRGDRLLLCSDGLWSSVDDAEIASVLGSLPVQQSVPELVERALRRAGERSDNVTVLAVEFEEAQEVAASRGLARLSTAGEVIASTIQPSVSGESQAAELDDDEIERSIREINEAIQRSSGKGA